MQEHVYQTGVYSVNKLKQCLIRFWCNLDQNIINMAIAKDSEHKFRVKGDHFQRVNLITLTVNDFFCVTDLTYSNNPYLTAEIHKKC